MQHGEIGRRNQRRHAFVARIVDDEVRAVLKVFRTSSA